jgi:hypothetical protein
VNGAVHGDSALVSADQLMAASRRDHCPGPPGTLADASGKKGPGTAKSRELPACAGAGIGMPETAAQQKYRTFSGTPPNILVDRVG